MIFVLSHLAAGARALMLSHGVARLYADHFLSGGALWRGTDGSNPSPSSSQSVSSGISPSCVEKPAVAAACAGMARRHDRQRPIGLVTITPIAGNGSVGRYSSTAAPKRGGLRTVVALVPSEGG